jgi:hypothetical protein
MNPNKIGRDMEYESNDLFFSDSHILTVSIISLFAIIFALFGLCFFLKLCKWCFVLVSLAFVTCAFFEWCGRENFCEREPIDSIELLFIKKVSFAIKIERLSFAYL